jgi:NAD(P)-dependent dehydrogenase (short-subunit alcohol dehydrogenase family)
VVPPAQVLKVHLFGSFAVARAAWPYMREAMYGRIVLITSVSGLYGAYGQARPFHSHLPRPVHARVSPRPAHLPLTRSARPAQANYSAAKAAMVGLAKTLAAEGERFGIKVRV